MNTAAEERAGGESQREAVWGGVTTVCKCQRPWKLGTREGMAGLNRALCSPAPAAAMGLLLCRCQKLRHGQHGTGCAEHQIPFGGCYCDSWQEMQNLTS